MTTISTTPALSQRRDARRNRQLIVKAARRCFARDGLDAGMDDIARAAGVGVGTVYRHFPNKDDLIEALATERFERLRDLAQEALAQTDPWNSFEHFMRASAQIQTDDRALSEILTSRPSTMMRAAESVDMLGLVSQILTRAQKAGVVRKDADPRDIPMIMCALAGTFRNPHADTERYMAIVLDGLRTPSARRSTLPASTRA
jgi:AcrR family transcriptional regulator